MGATAVIAAGAATSPAESTVGLPSSPPQTSAKRRLAAAILSFIGATLAGFSAFSPWWTIFGGTAAISFAPGDSFRIYSDSSVESVWVPWAAIGLGPLEALYQVTLALALAILVLGGVVGAFLLLVGLGKFREVNLHRALRNLLLFVLVTSSFAAAIVPILQPTLLTRSNANVGFCQLSGTSANPCNSFWGSGAGYDWGADVGWFLMTVAAILFLFSLLLWIPRRPKRTPSPPVSAITASPSPSTAPPAPASPGS